MQTYCDRCNEQEDHPLDISNDEDVGDLARELGYRSVCPGCYEDLLAEARDAREQQADDRRAEHRVPAAIPLRVERTDGGDPLETVTEDISENGARIRAAVEFEPGTVVHLSTDDGKVDAMAIVEVVWHDADALRAGLRLVEVSESWAVLVRNLEDQQD